MTAAGDLVVTDVAAAARLLRGGGLVAIPTETVYGLAAVADDSQAVRRIFVVKDRPVDHPLIVHVASIDHVEGWAHSLDGAARVLAEACWPGPLTLLLRRGPRTPDAVTGGRPTVGIRVPAHPDAESLLRELDTGLAAPSANRFGRVSPTTAQHVVDDLGGLLIAGRDAILDGGPCPIGVESTIVDCTVDPPQVLRPGGIPTEDVSRLLDGSVASAAGPSRTSGMLAAHYAPRCTVLLADDRGEAERRLEDLIAAGRRAEVLDRTDDLVAFAEHLYGDLRAADERGLDALVVVLPEARGLGHAVRDRLIKAASAAPPDRPSRDG